MAKVKAEARHYDAILGPVITEKATLLSEEGKVVFRVPLTATKTEIADASDREDKTKWYEAIFKKGREWLEEDVENDPDNALLPKMLVKIKCFLKKKNINFSKITLDGRTNSSLDEDIIINILKKSKYSKHIIITNNNIINVAGRAQAVYLEPSGTFVNAISAELNITNCNKEKLYFNI